jgi:hypothetical protein
MCTYEAPIGAAEAEWVDHLLTKRMVVRSSVAGGQ